MIGIGGFLLELPELRRGVHLDRDEKLSSLITRCW
jgi:hypothetical protein